MSMASAAHPAGTWVENRKTGELGVLRVAPEENGGRRLEADLFALPGAAVLGEHVHDHLDERFTVISGGLDLRRDGVEGSAGPGESVEVPAGTAHDWWNAGETVARVRVEVSAAGGGEPMAGRFLEMIEVAFGLANTGKTNEAGKPDLLWLAPFAIEYREVVRLTSPPAWVQRALFTPLAALGRATGHDPTDPSLHGPGCPAEVPAPPDYDESREDWVPTTHP